MAAGTHLLPEGNSGLLKASASVTVQDFFFFSFFFSSLDFPKSWVLASFLFKEHKYRVQLEEAHGYNSSTSLFWSHSKAAFRF